MHFRLFGRDPKVSAQYYVDFLESTYSLLGWQKDHCLVLQNRQSVMNDQIKFYEIYHQDCNLVYKVRFYIKTPSFFFKYWNFCLFIWMKKTNLFLLFVKEEKYKPSSLNSYGKFTKKWNSSLWKDLLRSFSTSLAIFSYFAFLNFK